VTLTATASIVTSAKWTPPAAGETVAVISASASASAATPPASIPVGPVLPLGPIPTLNGVSSSLIGAGNAASLFPAISPAATPSPSPGAQAPSTKRNAAPAADSAAVAPVLSAQVAGLIALALGIMLTVTRLSLRKRLRSPKHRT
jgi:hypothetical protein